MSIKDKVDITKKYKLSKFELPFILFVISAAFVVYFSLGVNSPLTADSAFSASIVRQISQTNQIQSTHPYIVAIPQMNLPILYPQLFFIEVAVLNIFIGKTSFDLISPLPVALLILSVYIFTRCIGDRKIAALASITLIGSYDIMQITTGAEPEPTLFFLMVVFLYCFIKLISSENRNWVFTSSIVLAGAIGMKQQWVFLILFVIIILILYLFLEKKQIILNILMMLCISGAFISPVLFYQFSTTGTILYLSKGTPQPIIQIEKTFAETLDIQKYELNPGWPEYVGNTSWVSKRHTDAESPTKIIDEINPLAGAKGDSSYRLYFILFFIFGTFHILRKSRWELIAILLLVPILIGIYVFLIPIWGYFLIIIPITIIFFVSGITTLVLLKYITKIVVPLTLMVLVVASVVSTVDSYDNLQQNSAKNRINMQEYEDMGAWILNNVPEDAVILTSRTAEIGYRSERKTVWLNLIGGTNIYEAFNFGNETKLINAMREYNASYVLISDWWIGSPQIWLGYMSSKGAKAVNKSDQFEEVYRTERVLLYRLKAMT